MSSIVLILHPASGSYLGNLDQNRTQNQTNRRHNVNYLLGKQPCKNQCLRGNKNTKRIGMLNDISPDKQNPKYWTLLTAVATDWKFVENEDNILEQRLR